MFSGLLARVLAGTSTAERDATVDPDDDREAIDRGRLNDGRVWLAVAMGLATTIAAVYVLTHPYPALGGGLFLAIAERILAAGYHLPATIPHYTNGGLPFAYPPLLFYGLAVLLDVGIDPLTIARVLPGLVTVLYLVPFYYLARELLGSVRRAGLATVSFAITPAVLEWHLSAGGIVRAPALLLTLTGLYFGVKLFRTRDRRWLPPAAVLFGLVLLSHPIDALVFGSSYVLFYAAYDRSPSGLVTGAVVAVGGVVLASPWWLQVLSTHGIGPFVSAAGTHGGFGGGLTTAPAAVPTALAAELLMLPWFALVAGGGAYLLARREFFLPTWFAFLLILTNKPRFAFVPGAMIAAAVVADFLLVPRNGEHGSARSTREIPLPTRTLLAGAFGLLVVVGGVYAAGVGVPLVEDDSLPVYLDDDDDAATEWAAAATPPDATFVVLGDAAEWFPLLADRTLLVGPWGVEWTDPDQYAHQRALYRSVSTCESARCLTTTLLRNDVRPEYVYVPTDSYTVERVRYERPADLRQSLVASDRYRLAFANDGVSIFRVTDANARARAPPDRSTPATPTLTPRAD